MKKFENPEVEVINFTVEDVVTESGGNGGNQPEFPDLGGGLAGTCI